MKINIVLDKDSFLKLNYRPFFAGMVAVFILKIATLIGITIPFL
ncbi:MAG TPA: hypothetical protein PLS49_01315 [Candidatus Woesebacteria bacterium]|nr:hypothetical protein [Candidatus Woesebacteria bacterium]